MTDELPAHLAGHEARYREIVAKLERDANLDPDLRGSFDHDPGRKAYFARRLLERELGVSPPLVSPERRVDVVSTPHPELHPRLPSPDGRLLEDALRDLDSGRVTRRRRGGPPFALGTKDGARVVAFAEPVLKVPRILRRIAAALEIVPRPDIARFYMPDGHTAFLDLSLRGIRPRLEVRRVDVPINPRKVPRPFEHELRVRVYRDG